MGRRRRGEGGEVPEFLCNPGENIFCRCPGGEPGRWLLAGGPLNDLREGPTWVGDRHFGRC